MTTLIEIDELAQELADRAVAAFRPDIKEHPRVTPKWETAYADALSILQQATGRQKCEECDNLFRSISPNDVVCSDCDNKWGVNHIQEQAEVVEGLRQHIAALEGEGEDGESIEAMTGRCIAVTQCLDVPDRNAHDYEPIHDAIYDALVKAKTMGRGVAAGERERMRGILQTCHKELDAIWSFHGHGLEVLNWHQNGDTEAFDNFLDDNDEGAVEASSEFLDDAEEDEAKKDV